MPVPGQPNLTQLLEAAVRRVGEEIRACIPGKATSVSADRGSCSVQPLVRRAGADGNDPVLPDVRVLWPTCGSARISWPFTDGDECLILFSDRSLSEWEAGSGNVAEAADPRTHDVSDAVVLPFGRDTVGLTRRSDLTISIDTSGGTVELLLQADGKVALGCTGRSGTYKDYQNNDQTWGSPTAVTCELVDLLAQFMDVLLAKTLVMAGSPDGSTTPVAFTESKWNLVSEIRAKLEELKGSLDG